MVLMALLDRKDLLDPPDRKGLQEQMALMVP